MRARTGLWEPRVGNDPRRPGPTLPALRSGASALRSCAPRSSPWTRHQWPPTAFSPLSRGLSFLCQFSTPPSGDRNSSLAVIGSEEHVAHQLHCERPILSILYLDG